MRLLHYLFRQKIFLQPRFDDGSYKGSLNPFISIIGAKIQYQTKFSSASQPMEAWGLKNYDMTFVHREIRTILFEYVRRGDAVVEFE